MLPGIFFLTTRILQLLVLIPMIGMLSYLVHGYVSRNLLTPNYILVLFIVSVLAGVWVLMTLIFYRSARRSGHFLALVDLGMFAALIAGVVILGGIAKASCSNLTSFDGYEQLAPFVNQWTKTCNILKACFGLGILSILLFFFSMVCLGSFPLPLLPFPTSFPRHKKAHMLTLATVLGPLGTPPLPQRKPRILLPQHNNPAPQQPTQSSPQRKRQPQF